VLIPFPTPAPHGPASCRIDAWSLRPVYPVWTVRTSILPGVCLGGLGGKMEYRDSTLLDIADRLAFLFLLVHNK